MVEPSQRSVLRSMVDVLAVLVFVPALLFAAAETAR